MRASTPWRVVWIAVAAAACSSAAAPDPPATPPPTATQRAEPAAAAGAADDRYDAGSLGALTFQLSQGTPAARAHFMRGMLALHSFWYDEAIRQFQAAIAADPTMNMAYWGVAMSSCKLLWGDDDLATARKMLHAMPDPDRLSDRELAWVQAVTELVDEGDVRASRKRFLAVMEAIHTQYPDDESATFLALALLSATHPEDPDNVEVRKRAAALAASVFDHNPKHPGAAHYLIHAYDTPELAPLALPYARAYANIAPAAFHARHMPAHIFSRLGMWPEAIASCRAAWDASVAAALREKLSADHEDFHSLNWIIEMSFEVGRRTDADAALATMAGEVRRGLGHRSRILYAVQVASYLGRTGEWARVDELLAPLATPATDEPAAATPARAGSGLASHCAPPPASSEIVQERLAVLDTRARAAAMQHDVEATTRLLGELETAAGELRAAELPSAADLAKRKAQAATHRGDLLARAHGDDRALLESLREATTNADQQSNGESNPTAFVVHEELGDTLMRLGQFKAAAAEYAQSLATQPGRARSLLGAARAAIKLGDAKTARARYVQLATQWNAADPGTEGLTEARAAVGTE